MNSWLRTVLFFLVVVTLTMTTSKASSAGVGTITTPRTLVETEYVPYDNGTPIYYEWKGEWYEGKITHYSTGAEMYTVTWRDEDKLEYFDDFSLVDKMVRAAEVNANPDLYNVGTPVQDGDKSGEIVDYVQGQYRVEWSEGTVQAYSPGTAFDKLVKAVVTVPPTTLAPTDGDSTIAPTDADSTEVTDAPATKAKYPVGTKVYKDFPDDATDDWYWGVVTWYEDGVYEIKWSDSTSEKYDEGEEMDQMVKDAVKNNKGDQQERNPWENGTAVYKVFPDGSYFGEIIGYAHGLYTIRWSDDYVAEYDVRKTDVMVDDAYVQVQAIQAAKLKQQQKETRHRRLSLFAIAFSGVAVAAVVFRRRRSTIEAPTPASSKDTNIATFSEAMDDPSTYKDQPQQQETAVESLPAVV
jgi:hypothetical protein